MLWWEGIKYLILNIIKSVVYVVTVYNSTKFNKFKKIHLKLQNLCRLNKKFDLLISSS